MSNICGLTQERVIYLRELTGEERVPLSRGCCQNPMPDGGVCGQPLSAHPSEQGKYIVFIIIVINIVNLAYGRPRHIGEWFTIYFFPFFFEALALFVWRNWRNVANAYSGKEDKLNLFYQAANDIPIQMVAFNPMIVQIVWTYLVTQLKIVWTYPVTVKKGESSK